MNMPKNIKNVPKNACKNIHKFWWLSILAPFFLSSCYSIAIAKQYLCLVSKGKNFAAVKQPSDEEKQLFERVGRIKIFAEEQLGLKATKNYSRYVRLERDYLTVVVSAAPALGFTDYQWNYPFVGKLPYRGYFDVVKAKKEAKRLYEEDYDVFIRPVDAFSTLGYVRDPLFSYMADYSEGRLANLIIHESFHATLFVRNDIALNESLANLVGKYASKLYLRLKYGESIEREQEEKQALAQQDARQFRSVVLKLKEQLKSIYGDSSRSETQKREAKQQTIAHWQQKFAPDQYGKYFQTDAYQYIATYSINNAYLSLFSLYEDPDNFLDNIYQKFLEQTNGDELAALQQFIQLCRQLGKKYKHKTRQALYDNALQAVGSSQ